MSGKSRFLLAAVLLVLASCDDGWEAVNPFRSSLGPEPVQSPSSPFGHGYKNAAQSEPGLLLANWAPAHIDASMDDASRLANQQAERRAFNAPIGQQITWHGDSSDDSGVVVPIRDYYDADGSYCREFQQNVTLSGSVHTGQAKACQQPDGSWQIAK